MFTVETLEITDDERSELERRVGAHKSSQRESRRARVILLCADGKALRQIGTEIGMDQHQVGQWRRRFLTDRLDGLEDKSRSGRPRRLGHDERMRLAGMANSEKDNDDPIPTWTHQELADSMTEAGIPVSTSQVGRILKAMNIDVTRVR